MHVGASVIFQSYGSDLSDRQIYANDLALVDLVEPLGYESIWSVEHHFTDYTMCPDVYQFLSYCAGRTTTAHLGSMVIVLPWHDPLRAAEEITMLDNLSGGRVILGIGRGAGKVEFDGFRMNMAESRERFVEAAQSVLGALENGYIESDGQYYKQPKTNIRPAPFKSFRDRTFAAAVSPESSRIMAELGIGILIIPQKPWDAVAEELKTYRKIFRETNGREAPAPISAGWIFCDEDKDRAAEMAVKYIGGYWESVLEHYQFASDHLKTVQGYEYYGKFADTIQKYGADSATEFFMNLQVWGTPDMCYERILDISDRTGADGFIGVFGYAGMPGDEAERNMRLFAQQVAPRLKKLPSAAERATLAA
ncbi:MAG: Alkanal monooxygenase alpha chain [Alphaproteobacteria bacterium MarineAlpha4_Bin2]|nr:MAG: Alkanal monooxygenase alpha chain [Alphaproteobacteria bacterium MarineAlpha4_Bin2]